MFVCHKLYASGMLDPWLEPHQCLYTSMWIETAQLPCRRRNRGASEESIMCRPRSMQAGVHTVFETQDKYHQKFKTEVSVAQRQDQCPPKNFLKRKRNEALTNLGYKFLLWRNIYWSEHN